MQLVVETRANSELCVLCVDDGKKSTPVAIFLHDDGLSIELYKSTLNLMLRSAHAIGQSEY